MEKMDNYNNAELKNVFFCFEDYLIEKQIIIEKIQYNEEYDISWNNLGDYIKQIIQKEKNETIFNLIIFFLFSKKVIDLKSNFKIELYNNSLFQKDLINYRNYIVCNLFNILSSKDKDIKIDKNLRNLYENQKNIKSNYIRKCFHVVKQLFSKEIKIEEKIFYSYCFLYKNYNIHFREFLNKKLNFKKEIKKLLIEVFNDFEYNESSSLEFGNKVFYINLAVNYIFNSNDSQSINNFFKEIKYQKLKESLLKIYNKTKEKEQNNEDNKKDKDEIIFQLNQEITQLKEVICNLKKEIKVKDNLNKELLEKINKLEKNNNTK